MGEFDPEKTLGGIIKDLKLGKWYFALLKALRGIGIALLFFAAIYGVFVRFGWVDNPLGKPLTSDFTASIFLRGYPQETNVIQLGGGTLRPFKTFENPDPAHQITLVRNMAFSQLPDEMAPQSSGSAYSYQLEPKEKDLFTFYQTSPNNSRVIDIYRKNFRVTLINIVPRENTSSTDTRLNYEYQFVIDEE
ncbi:MAG: hypothetical protein A2653_02340 [Candidatus Zambryskibacteria bacterium RIFCSPHIGHO2_01_FULL_43_25]|uniref:Uncharacterized protein n=1 Tax=Candidatus Zambryskibacteria bacterium RIFCSPLOWO2_01_FULL_45_21 TaxID=1802761 RepID=A0A1G2U320_9BACT|nr:MAG: hypothetical protein A2653_02340 [Candidatus Zambryskibacteria bacterium RIFCSPHIGHO2_01_FULL_43_25]OHB01039.1 MAG: hypothetical protein A3E94_02520 [Candidatus Zambryskibacteria bacterium RIFCSPHIGHO2_12_FULL_44_12b]OHB03916.1 MAG: hypothetical protein A3B14_01110 [Candidatus Zambryskibacteria bacterium RIFCSPLOWO2_01_FULL_45_21]